MLRDVEGSRSFIPRIVYGLAATLCVLAPFVLFLSANNYALLSAEVIPMYLGAAAVGVLVALLATSRSAALARFALWGCAFVSIAFLYDIEATWVAGAVLVGLGIAVVALADNAATVLFVAAALHIASTIAMSFLPFGSGSASHAPVEVATTEASDLPPVIHIVLDEYTGLRGLPDEFPVARTMRSQLLEYYRNHGFDLATHAYAQYALTTNSLPHLFNFTSDTTRRAYVEGSDNEFVLTKNQYFEHISGLGYDLHVRQSTYLDYCSTPGIAISTCRTYENNSIESIAPVGIPRSQKSLFILNSYLDSSAFLRRLRRVYVRNRDRLALGLPTWPAGNSRVGPLALLSTIEEFEARLRTLQMGEFHFAHLMLPHHPYVLNSDCSVKQKVRSWLNIAPFEVADALGEQNSRESRAERYAQYIEQLGCTNAIVDRLLEAVRASGHWERSVIILHGDHGSRIFRNALLEQNLDTLTDDDYRDGYSAFFAAKIGATGGEVITEPRALPTLLSSLWNISGVEVDSGQVYVQTDDRAGWIPTSLRGFGPLEELEQTSLGVAAEARDAPSGQRESVP